MQTVYARVDGCEIRTLENGVVAVVLDLAYDECVVQCATLSIDKLGYLLRFCNVRNVNAIAGRIIRVKRDEGWAGLVKQIGDPIRDEWCDI